MSSTLSEGVRVPDIGSTSWGADVNFNWGLLNTCLANISSNVKVDAENTWTAPQTFTETISGSITRAVGDEDGTNIKAALAGKQSSLSQAQLDACNSGITATAVQQIADNATAIAGKAADNTVVHLAGAETISGDKTFTGAVVTHNITPETDNTYSLGSSSYQWNSVYAQAYYYNGTELQNKFVTVDTDQTITGRKNFKTSYSDILPKTVTFPSSTRYYVAQRDYAYNNESLTLTWAFVQTSGINVRRWYIYPYSSGDSVYFQININADGSSSEFKTNVKSVIPVTNNATDLGTSDNKWKTLNGINPGALGMIDTSTYVDIDTTEWVTTGATNRVYINGADPTFPGFLFIRASGTAADYIAVRIGGTVTTLPVWTSPYDPAGGGLLHVVVPCPANSPIRVYTSVAPAVCRYYACLGNV